MKVGFFKGPTEERTFHARNESRSMIVEELISFPGKTPQVTALLPSSVRFVA